MHCFCPNGKCTPKGTLDLYPCTEIPIVASMPHFCNGEQSLFDKVESGIKPDREKHLNFIDFEIVGIVLCEICVCFDNAISFLC